MNKLIVNGDVDELRLLGIEVQQMQRDAKQRAYNLETELRKIYEYDNAIHPQQHRSIEMQDFYQNAIKFIHGIDVAEQTLEEFIADPVYTKQKQLLNATVNSSTGAIHSKSSHGIPSTGGKVKPGKKRKPEMDDDADTATQMDDDETASPKKLKKKTAVQQKKSKIKGAEEDETASIMTTSDVEDDDSNEPKKKKVPTSVWHNRLHISQLQCLSCFALIAFPGVHCLIYGMLYRVCLMLLFVSYRKKRNRSKYNYFGKKEIIILHFHLQKHWKQLSQL